MANEFEAKIGERYRGSTERGGIIAKMADGFGKQGLTERAFQSLLE